MHEVVNPGGGKDAPGASTSTSDGANGAANRVGTIQDQVDKGILSADKVVDSELHLIVVEARDALVVHKAAENQEVIKEPNAKQNDEEWHTVMNRKKTAQLKKVGKGVINKGDGSDNALPSSNG
ncbi:hypothetical protein RIF29_14221 [Crotalaria pallida]|uniref:Uncharacterized protein n=1 Tax=Crotalaria pallida TaxID=3830 RepID=A0AAN9IA39_CROPI